MRQEVIYRFMELPTIVQCQIGEDLECLSYEETCRVDTMTNVDLCKTILARVQSKGLEEQLWKRTQEEHQKLKGR